MELTKDDIKNLASLAGLSLSEQNAEAFSHDISKIVSYVSEINSINLDEIEAIYDNDNYVRDDVSRLSSEDTRALIMQNAPEEKDGYIVALQVSRQK